MKQIIIAVGREFGSGGLLVAEKLAEHYNIPIYSKEMMAEVAKESEYSEEVLRKYDEKPMNLAFIPAPIGGNTLSLEQGVAISQFNFLRKKANEEKESFVVVGRCADEILADNPNLVRVFVLGNRESKIRRVMKRDGIDEKSALAKMKKADKVRKTYHNFYCENKWGDSRSYDMCISTSKVDEETAAKIIIEYVDSRMK